MVHFVTLSPCGLLYEVFLLSEFDDVSSVNFTYLE